MRLHRIRISYYLSEANVLSLSSTAPYTASLRFAEGGKGRPREMPTLLRVFVRKPPHPRHSLAGPWRVEKLLLIIAAARMESALPQRTARKTRGKEKKKKRPTRTPRPADLFPHAILDKLASPQRRLDRALVRLDQGGEFLGVDFERRWPRRRLSELRELQCKLATSAFRLQRFEGLCSLKAGVPCGCFRRAVSEAFRLDRRQVRLVDQTNRAG